MGSFFGISTNNTNNLSKEKIRQNIFDLFENKKNVLEIFCGSGEMYRKVWKNADKYTGIDIIEQNDERHTICGDSMEVLKKIDINEYNIFDIDSYGGPYEELNYILNNINTKQKEIAFVLTDGSHINLALGHINSGYRKILGIKSKRLTNAHLLHDMFIKKILEKIKSTFNPVETKFYITTGKTGACVKYYAIFLRI
jgi:nitrate reductase beta subunit